MPALSEQHLVMGLRRISKCARGTSVAYTELVVEEKEVEDIERVRNYPHLHHVSFGGNSLKDLTPLASLPDLLTLDVSNNELTDALDFGEGKTSNNLQRAILSGNKISELSALAPHIHLTTLILSDNSIRSLAVLRNLHQLRYLDVSGNQLETLEGFNGQPIQELHLSNNKLNTLAGIKTLQALEVVTLNSNRLTTLAPLDRCHNLTAVEAENNMLEMEPVVVPLQGLQFLRHLRLSGNPVETGMKVPPTMPKKFKDMALPDFRRLVYRWRLVYRLLRLETLDGTGVTPEEKVTSANFCGADRDAHDHCYLKYFPATREPMRGRELTITRLHRPEPYVEGEMLFPDVWIHRLVQRALEQELQVVRVSGAWDVDSTVDPAEETIGITVADGARVIVVLGVSNSCNLGVQKCSSSVAVITKETLEWRVRQVHSCLDREHMGMCALEELQHADAAFFKKLQGDAEGKVTQAELLEYFATGAEEQGAKVAEAVVAQLEQELERQGITLPAPAETRYLESGHSKSMASIEGDLKGGSYLVSARCSLSEQGALEKASGGEPFFCWVFSDMDFTAGGLASMPMAAQQDLFSTSYVRPLSRMQLLQSRAGAVTAELDTVPELTEDMCVGRYGAQVSDYAGGIDVMTLEIFADGTAQMSHENHPQERAPSLDASWIDASWGLDPAGRLIVEGVEGDMAAVAVLLPMEGGFEQESLDYGEIGQELVRFFGPVWYGSVKYRETFAQGIVEHKR